jgi:transposase
MESDVRTYGSFHGSGEGYAGRIDGVTGPTGRRRWPEPVTASIVLETCRDGVFVAEIARKHDISPPQLHGWRRAARDGLLPMPEDDGLAIMRGVMMGAPR